MNQTIHKQSVRNILLSGVCLLVVLAASFLSGCASTSTSAPAATRAVTPPMSFSQVAPAPAIVMAQFGGSTRAYVGSVSCLSGGTNIVLLGASEIIVHNFTADVIQVYPDGSNSDKAKGIPVCNVAATCIPWFKIPAGSDVWECSAATKTLNLVGVAQ